MFVWQQHQADAMQPEVMGRNQGTQPAILGIIPQKKKNTPWVSICCYTSAQPKTKTKRRLPPCFTLPSSTVHLWSVTPTSCSRQGQSLHPTRLLRALASPILKTSRDAGGTLRFIVLTRQYSYQRLTFTALTIVVLQAGRF